MLLIRDQIEKILQDGLRPARLRVTDQSHMHAGHHGHSGAGETHFDVLVVAEAFENMGRVERQRLVYGLLAPLMNNPIHALSLSTRTPDEAGKTQFYAGGA